LQDEVVVTTDQ